MPDAATGTDITFNCDNCGQNISIDEAGAGSVVECPKCERLTTVPSAQQAATTPQANLINCPDCGRQISKRAASCPNCGARLVVVDDAQFSLGCASATTLQVIAVLEILGAIVGGAVVGSENGGLGFAIFISGIISGIFIIGFACALDFLHETAYRLRKIESILAKG